MDTETSLLFKCNAQVKLVKGKLFAFKTYPFTAESPVKTIKKQSENVLFFFVNMLLSEF